HRSARPAGRRRARRSDRRRVSLRQAGPHLARGAGAHRANLRARGAARRRGERGPQRGRVRRPGGADRRDRRGRRRRGAPRAVPGGRDLHGRRGVERGRRTPVKTRIMAGGYQATRQQVVRLDREPAGEPQPTTEVALVDRLNALAVGDAAIVISDYGYGTVTPRLFECVKKFARSANAIVSVDSRYHLPRFGGVTVATPNEAELEQLTGVPVDDERAVEKAGRHLLERLDARILLITRGSRGMALLERDGATTFIPIHGTDEIADVTGAGD